MPEINKEPRSNESRTYARRPDHWSPPETLPMPAPEEGFEFRYIRIATMGESDPANISSRLREGWLPVKAEDYPELMAHAVEEGKYAGCVEFGGLLLCKVPREFMDDRRRYHENMTRSQIEAVDNDMMKEQDPRMPMFRERQTRVSQFGRGN